MVDRTVIHAQDGRSLRGDEGNSRDSFFSDDALSPGEERFQELLKTTEDGILLTDESGVILSFNRVCEKIFGFEASEVIGKDVTMLMMADHARIHSDIVGQHVKGGGENVLDVPRKVLARHKNGSPVTIEIAIGEAQTALGRQFIGVVRDLRPYKIVHREMVEMRRQLLQRSAGSASADTSAVIAHELYQPLTALKLYLQAVKKKTETGDAPCDDLNQILSKASNETERVTQIVERMRHLGKVVPKNTLGADLEKLILDAVELTMIGHRRKGLNIKTSVQDGLPLLRIDPVQIQQVLVNLLRNAIEAVREQEDAWVRIMARNSADFVLITVQDSGSGVPENIRGRLFHGSASNKKSGMGIGLAISQAIAERHGGHVKVEYGGNGRGASFTLLLPVNKGERNEY